MGRLQALTLLCGILALSALDCDDSAKKPPTVTRERSQAVVAKPGASSASEIAAEPVASVGAPSTAAASAPAKPRARKLCEGAAAKAPRSLPKSAVSRAAAPGAPGLPAALPVSDGVWTWVNFWAAWCVPCKEEIPRLKSWEQKLNASGKSFQLLFVSLDDDPRQLQDFLKAESAGGLRSTYWLREGKERQEWLKGAELGDDPGLPMHLIVDPSGKVRCKIDGAVEESDFEQLSRLIGR